MSFRWCASRYVPRRNARKRAAFAVALLLLAGCGGEKGAPAEKVVRGAGYRFSAPASWAVARAGRELRVSEGIRLVSVTRFPLVRAFRPSLWQSVVPELDRTAAALAKQQNGKVAHARTLTVDGREARSYDVDYERDGKKLVERITFVLRAKTEYLLLCRYERGGDTRACERLLATFKLT